MLEFLPLISVLAYGFIIVTVYRLAAKRALRGASKLEISPPSQRERAIRKIVSPVLPGDGK